MIDEPLFIKYVNGVLIEEQLLNSFLSSAKDEKTKDIILRKKEEVLSRDYSYFKRDFKELLLDLIDNGITQRLINYVNSYMKPSLEEYVVSSNYGRIGEDRFVGIKDEDAPWFEALVCYNLCLYIKVYGIKVIKQCPVCMKIFSTKGKYAKYCSEICKQQSIDK